MEKSEIHEIGQVVFDLQSRLRVASAVSQDQPRIAKENLLIARQVCGRILNRIDDLIKE